MPNKWAKCEICLYRHAPGKCKGNPGERVKVALNAIDWQSAPDMAEGVVRFLEELVADIRRRSSRNP